MGFPYQRGNAMVEDILLRALLLVVLLWLCLTWYCMGPRNRPKTYQIGWQQASQLSLVQDNHLIEHLGSDTANEPFVGQDHQYEEDFIRHDRHSKKVKGNHVLDMVLQEGLPRWREKGLRSRVMVMRDKVKYFHCFE
jgi:hypothetical protein